VTDTLARALEPAGNGIDRRKLLKMGVWAAPVVVFATAAPAAAASAPESTATVTTPAASHSTTGDVQIAVKATAVASGIVGGVTATLVVTPSKPSQPGQWADTSATTTPKAVADTTAPYEFAFPTFVKHNKNATYTYTVSFAASNDVTKVLATISGAF